MRSSAPLITVALIAILQCTRAAPDEDLVTDLPGLSKQPPFKHYSGYLRGDHVGDKFLHYWFVESSSNPHTDPVVLWLNGGPGCSSMVGLLTENGPFQNEPDGESLRYNPYSWNQAANMIYLESPVGVGFSYSKSGNIKVNDSVVAVQNAIALENFFEKFPEYRENEFYITGESYAGIYIPSLAVEILDKPCINFKGFAIGNALSDRNDNDNSLIYFSYFHGLIGDVEWDFLLNNCCPDNKSNRCDFMKSMGLNQKCNDTLKAITNMVWRQGLNVYNLYKECAGGVNTGFSSVYKPEERKFVTTYFGWPFSFLKEAQEERDNLRLLPKHMVSSELPCSDMTATEAYCNRGDVRKALHISPQAEKWASCSNQVEAIYQKVYTTTVPFYEKLLAHTPKLRMMIYNGDVDMACNFLGDEWFVNRLPLQNPSDRKFWYYKAKDGTRQIAGFIKTFDQMSLVTIKGSGHMVPTDMPIPALDLFINFLQDKPF